MRFTTCELEEYGRALEARVCSMCRTAGYDGLCAIGDSGECPIRKHLPRILEAVLSTPRSTEVSAYVPALRSIVCAHCERQDEEGVCAARDLTMCGLDAYLLVAVSTVEEVHDRLASGSRSGVQSTERTCEPGPSLCSADKAASSD